VHCSCKRLFRSGPEEPRGLFIHVLRDECRHEARGDQLHMSKLMLFFQSKLVLAMIGTVLFGGTAALLASQTFPGPATHPSAQQPQTAGDLTAGATSTATRLAATATATTRPSPSATPTSRVPTSTPSPTATTPSGQTTTLRGTVTKVNTSSGQFTARISGGATKTVTVQSQTTFQGACTSLSGLQPGWFVVVQGTYQPDGSFAATSVTSSFDN
jgi:hypothetical protein